MGISFHCESDSVFVDPMGVEVAFGLFPMTATNAEQGLIVGVVECSIAGIDLGLAVGLGAPCRIPGGDPLGISFEPASHSRCSFRLRPLPHLRQGVLRLLCLLRNFFRAALSLKSGGPAR